MHKLCVLLPTIAVLLGAAACGGGSDSRGKAEPAPEVATATQEAAAPVEAPAADVPATTGEAPAAAEEPVEAQVTVPREQAIVRVAFNDQLRRKILVDSRGYTLYLVDWDTAAGHSTCIDDPTYHCSKVWPPLLTIGKPRAGKGVTASLLGTDKRDDGTVQVTYSGHPVYLFAGYGGTPADSRPGDVYGQGFISDWWVLSPKGKAVGAVP